MLGAQLSNAERVLARELERSARSLPAPAPAPAPPLLRVGAGPSVPPAPAPSMGGYGYPLQAFDGGIQPQHSFQLPAPALGPPPVVPEPQPRAGPAPGAPPVKRSQRNLIPAWGAVIGTNVPYSMDGSCYLCYTCKSHGHVAWSCPRSAATVLGEPYPGWNPEGVKIPECWTGDGNSCITVPCARLWVSFFARHPELSLNMDTAWVRPLPDFNRVASGR
eukprot:3933841-Rhodomonas_salina.3